MNSGARTLLAGALFGALLLVVLEAGGGGLAVVGDDKADQRVAPDRVSLTGVAARLNFAPDRGRFALHAALAEEVPGAILSVVSADDPIDAGRLLRVGRASAVRLASQEDREPLERAIETLVAQRGFVGLATRSGSVRHAGQWWEWELHLLDADARDLVIHAPGGLLVVADARLLPPDARASIEPAAPVRAGRVRTAEPLTAGLVEASLLLGLLLLGGLLLPRGLLAQPQHLPAALIVGLAALGVVGSFTRGVLLIPTLLVVTTVLHALLSLKGHAVGWRRHDLGLLLGAASVLGALAVAVRTFGLVHVSTDTIGYLDASSELAATGPSLGSPSGGSASLVAIHALGAMVGVDGIFSLGPASMLAGALLLLGAALREPHDAPTVVLGLVGVALLAASGFVRLLTMLVNSHAYVAVLLLTLAVLWRGTLAHPSDRAGTGPAAGLLAAAVALGRPEGPVLVLLLLAGTLVARRWTAWRPAWFAVGGVVLARPAAQLLGGSVDDGTSDRVLIALGVAALLAPFIIRRLPSRWRRALPASLIGSAWIILAVSADRGSMPGLVGNTRENLLSGAGGWGLTVPTLLVLLILAAALAGSRRSVRGWGALAPLATPVAGFLPVMLLVRAFGSESAGRVHWHDSNNRMWLHVVPILLLLVFETARTWSDARLAGERATPGIPQRLAAGAAVIALALPAFAWQPTFARESPRDAVLLAEQAESRWKGDGVGGQTGRVGPTLIGLETVLTRVPFDLAVLSSADPARPGELCVGVRLGTFGRSVIGGVEIAVVSGRLDSSEVVDVRDLEDLERALVCIDLDEQQGGIGLLGDDALITIRGRGTVEGAAPAVMLDEAGAPVLSVDLSWSDAPRRDEPLVRMVPPVALIGIASLALLMLLAPLRPRWGALERT